MILESPIICVEDLKRSPNAGDQLLIILLTIAAKLPNNGKEYVGKWVRLPISDNNPMGYIGKFVIQERTENDVTNDLHSIGAIPRLFLDNGLLDHMTNKPVNTAKA